jgi:hypothetical protein
MFEERYYRWALEDWRREIEQDFVFLRSLKEHLVLRMMESLRTEEQFSLARALVKRGRKQEFLEMLGDQLTRQEQKYVQWYANEITRAVSMPRVLPEDTATSNQAPQKSSSKKLNRKKLKQCVAKAVSPILGNNFYDWGYWQEWMYFTKIGPWQVVSYFDVGSQFHQLCYDHSIIVSEQVRLLEGISILSWLGIAGQTQWQGLTDSDAESTADSLAQIVAHFMEAAPKLLDGLSPD